MDDFDHASEMEEQYRALAIAAARRPAHQAAESAAFCQNEECGVPIPEERRRAVPGCRFCIECQMHREQVVNRRYTCK
ncbi:TraR/DksA C4-type zinc finger protein [Burkholderia cenocepacia]|uniref:TraR/DksA C4-type zinc finger protein n=1 Tax=Burkholderia cenocepacia TaxID=95486 RepID=UPI00209ED756|nr:TraR/DksA C4-type zinc finger protein [Burkholderia cenocepacia]MCO8326822.1 TraR/DksA C4-type zinc finger protein [Burkholderia cenocepacia]MCO8333885.1 TraR/DksA C4-type zinc finger protein [Burkholderia cenocepacia]MCO8341258.1 TraR/DksA C4-type zinc finger protein [Burkholderia cenocepacia]MCO8348678.1 TraR/DksA C4-type zinc finger protein [Burkholderia cenocepacia]MCO8361870.1 TraR/DksA C4-type zinc finger protein [Burkholderia cenocepacia]